MALILRVKLQDGSTRALLIEEGLVIGRSPQATLCLPDPKMSGRHAQIERNSQGHFILVDLGSTNKIRFKGRKLDKLHLEPGVQFKLGSTVMHVEDGPPPLRRTPTLPLDEITRPREPKPAPEPAAPPEPPPKWSDYFLKFIANSMGRIKNRPQSLKPFERMVTLKFIRGLQTETEWVLGYGPRYAGPASHDLVIDEPDAPSICFSLQPQGSDTVFITEHPDRVRLNDQAVRTDTVKPGDVISIGKTQIQIGFVE